MTGNTLCAFSTYATCELHILGHDRHTLGVDGAQVRVLEQTDEVRLGSLLQFSIFRVVPCGTKSGVRYLESSDSSALEAQIGLEVLRDLTHETLKSYCNLMNLWVPRRLARSFFMWSFA